MSKYYQTAGKKGEPAVVFNFCNLEIEHILPQKWEQHWPLPETENARVDREHILHCIGNLTLVSGKLNPMLSNAAWHDDAKGTRGKLTLLSDHSQLRLNDQLVKKYGDGWNENAIKKRGLELFEAACLIWPDPAVLAGLLQHYGQ